MNKKITTVFSFIILTTALAQDRAALNLVGRVPASIKSTPIEEVEHSNGDSEFKFQMQSNFKHSNETKKITLENPSSDLTLSYLSDSAYALIVKDEYKKKKNTESIVIKISVN